jgi:thioester reductase-like protein
VPTALITGFPGFLGSRLVATLLEKEPGRAVVALVEPRMEQTARERAPAGLEVLPGDIGERRLGIGDETYERLAAEVSEVHHLAAIYNLAVPLELAQKVNVDGTGNILEFCRHCERLDRLHYVSTAYVAGERTGVVYEHELSLGQRFKNHYESTKFQAELWVRDQMDKVPTTIYRPAIVVGDSQTGETQKFDGPYYMLRVISRSVKTNIPIPQFGRSAAPFNVVPVDFVIDAMTTLGGDAALAGATLHLVDPEPVPSSEVLELLAKTYAGKGPGYRVPPKIVAASLRSGTVRRAFGGAPRESIVYLNHPVRFDTRVATEALARNGLRCPRLEEYVGPLVRFYREHEDEPAFAPA